MDEVGDKLNVGELSPSLSLSFSLENGASVKKRHIGQRNTNGE